jgi:transposase-like protein
VGRLNILNLLNRIAITAAIAFAFWFVGGELLFSTLSGIAPQSDPNIPYILSTSIGIILGIAYGLILVRIFPGIVTFIVGTITGSIISLTLTMIIGSILYPLSRVVGLAFFLVPGLILNTVHASRVKSAAAARARPKVEPPKPKPETSEKPTAETPTTTAEAPAQPQQSSPQAEAPSAASPEQPVQTTSQPEKPELIHPEAGQPVPSTAAVESEIKSKSEQEITVTEGPEEQLMEKLPEEKIITPISNEDIEDKVLEIIEKEGLTEIIPLPSNLSPEGGFYPDLEEKLNIDTSKLLQVLKSLTDRGILKPAGVEFKKVVCPRCLSALNIINLGCPYCRSINIARQRILQHEACGFLGPEERFTETGKTVCPRCGAEVEIIRGQSEEAGKDVLKVHSTLFTCYNCNEVSTEPYVSFRCLTCGMIYDLVSFESKSFYRYTVNLEALYKALELKKPLKIIVEEATKRGIEVQQQVMISGASKVPHKVNLLFKKDGRIVGAAILITDKGESHLHEIMRVLVLRTDAGIKNLYVLSYYKLDEDARKLAQFNEIPLIEDVLSKDIANEIAPRILKSMLES